MKPTTTPFLKVTSLLAIGAAVLLAACSKTDNTGTGSTTAASDTTATTPAMTASTTDTWDNLKDYSYDQRTEFAAKAQAMADQLDAQTANAQGEASRELAEARDELRTAAAEVSNATAETWEATKERVGRAWQKAESSFQNAAE